jgi:hypothetical protein
LSFHAKTVSSQEKAGVVVWFSEFKFIVRVQREFHHVYQKAAPEAKRIKAWHKFLETGRVLKGHGGGRRVPNEKEENLRMVFI